MPTKKPAPARQSAAESAAKVRPTPKVNKVTPENDKVSKKTIQDKRTVKSSGKSAQKPVKRGPGNISTYSEAMAANICDLIADGVPLREICRHPGMPAWRTVYAWRTAHPDFDARIAHARVAGFDAIAEETLAIADETSHDTISTENGDRPNTEWIARSKLRIETRLKLLAKWDPKRYGDKVDVNHGVQPENPLASLMAQLAGKTLKPVANPEDGE